MKLIGAGLYRHLLQRALVIARGEEPPEDWRPEVHIGATGSFPEAYVPEPDLRINLYARLFAAGTARDIDALADEIEDRFGPLPEAVSGLLARVRLGVLCRQAGVARLDAGPQGIALTFRPGTLSKPGMEEAVAAMGDSAEFRGERLIVSKPSETAEERQRLAADLLEALS
jgi:transcription-repair coupling factor (superfamily II helicase)